MKVLHIISGLGSGGAQKLVADIVPMMNEKKDLQVDVLLLTNKKSRFEELLVAKGVKISVIPLQRPRNPVNIFYIRSYMKKGNYDIVHVHLFPTIYWTAFAIRLLRKNKPKLIMTEHNTYNRRRSKWYLRYVEKQIYDVYDKVISISNETDKNLLKWLDISSPNEEKFVVIENGINIDDFRYAKPYAKNSIRRTLKEDDRLLCMVGRFSEQKDQYTIIKAMKYLPNDINLLLIGEGPLRSKGEYLASSLGLDDRVHFLGFRNDVKNILKTVDIVILSSHWEGFGLAAVEGMAAGKPVIASDVPGLGEIVKGYGSLFRVNDSRELATKIKEVLSDRLLYNEISEKCTNRAYDYTVENMVLKHYKVYHNMLIQKGI